MTQSGARADGLDHSGDEDGVMRVCSASVSACTRSSVMGANSRSIGPATARRLPHRIGRLRGRYMEEERSEREGGGSPEPEFVRLCAVSLRPTPACVRVSLNQVCPLRNLCLARC